MHELITRLTQKAGISQDQAAKVLDTVKDFVKEKFPMMSGAVDNLFAGESTTGTTAIVDPGAPTADQPGMLDKISDVIPGSTGQKIEDFAKGAADKAGDAFDSVKDKLGGMFGGDKK